MLDRLPRLGWIVDPSPVDEVLGVSPHLPRLRLKRDDRLGPLHGGTKVRKLDVLLAHEPWASAKGWVVSGAVGSGQVVATVAAGQQLGRAVHAHLFCTSLGAHGRENFAFSTSYATSITGYGSRPAMALRSPAVLLAKTTRKGAVIPPGATEVHGLLGCTLGGLELAEQLRSAPPDAVYAAYGTGGTVVGVAAGLALAGLSIPVRAVGVVERLLSPDVRLRQLEAQLRAALATHGVTLPPLRIEVLRGQLGAGYAWATAASVAGAARLMAMGVAGEPVYTGKAFAALLADAEAGRTRDPLLWVTVRRGGLPYLQDWEDRLPRVLRGIDVDGDAPPGSRRAFLLGLGAAAALVGVARCTGYDGPDGRVLSAAERAVVRAAGEALFPDLDPAVLDRFPSRVDDYVSTFPDDLRAQVHGLLFAVEHTVALSAGLHRFSAAAPADRLHALQNMEVLGGPGRLVARSMRDLVLVAAYQDPILWAEVGYEGPMVGAERRPSAYDALRAPPGWVPFSEPG